MGIPNDALPPNMAGNQQQQFQMPMQQSQQPQQQNVAGRPPNAQVPLSQQDAALVLELTNRLLNQASVEEKNNLRAGLQSRMDAQALQNYQSRGVDPLFLYYRNQALNRLRQEKQVRMAQAQAQQAQAQQQLGMSQPPNMPAAPAMQQQRSMNPSPLNGAAQPPTSMGGNTDFGSFMGNNLDNIAVQQQQGVMAQAEGQMVVPASAARNGTPQPAVMPGQQMNANPNARVQQQQQMFNVQQAQQQRMQQAAQSQQQSQAQARLNAQQKAQQMALQGQPGGMGPGPMPPQQSPAMATLNAPLRTPSQQMNHPEPPQINPNAQFGQPLDPRFINQGNQRQLGSGNGFNPAMFAGMPQEQQQRLAGLPPDKLNEVVTKWHEQRAQQMNATNVPGGRPGMPMQGNNQARPGQQVPQPGQFNPQNAITQFMLANPGQRPPPAMMANMNPQQQIMLQQQIARLAQNPLQQRNVPQNLTPTEQHTIMQMDSLDFPQSLQNHQHVPRGIPPEVKKWGQLKQWVQQNPTLGPEALQHLKALQKMHYTQLMRQRSAQQPNQPMNMQQGLQAGQVGVPPVPAGMSAPVAPMGQNPMQMPNGLNMGPGQIRQPTQQDIQNARNHSSGKMANATDDQIRSLLIRHNNQLTPQQQQQRQAQLLQMQMASQMNQMNGQQNRPGMQPQPQPQQNVNSMGAAQPGQIPQSKPSVSAPETAVQTANNANIGRAARPPPNGRAAAQNSSSAHSKNLKRASSDDVVEVPNPNAQQPPRSVPQPAQGQKQSNQQPGRPNLTPQQVAQLAPEPRKRYEDAMRIWQMKQASQLTAADMEKLKSISREETLRAQETLPDIPMDSDAKAAMAKMLKDILQPLSNVGKALPKWYQITHDEHRVRMFFRTVSKTLPFYILDTNTFQQLRLKKLFRDPEMTQLRDEFSISPKEIEQARLMLSSMVKDLSDRFPKMKKPEAAQSQSQSTAAAQPSATSQPPASTSVPLTAASLQQQQQQLNKMHQRSNSRSSHTPAAPTSSQPPFQFGASSPHGAPAYIGKTAITQDNLHLPARKKQKPNNNAPVPGQSTPGSNSSPQVTKAVSPEIKRQQAETKPQVKPTLICSELDCDRHDVGFDSEEALKLHRQEEHIRPLENPLQYAQEPLASMLGLDSQGRSKKPAAPATQEPVTAPAGAKMMAASSRQGQTPNVKGESTPAATPMNRQVSMNRQASAAGVKSSPQPKAKVDSAKDALAKVQAMQKENKQQSSQPVQEPFVDPWANATIDPHDLFQPFQGFESGAGGAISDMNVYRSITPNDTPESSKDGVSEPNSDISDGVALDINLDIFDESWMPFGPSDSALLYNTESFNVNTEGDLPMLDNTQSALDFSWDDMVDQSAFDKPFAFDPSFYSMNVD